MTFNGKFWEIHRKPLYLIHLYSMDGMSAGKKKTFLDFLAPSAPRTGGFTGEAKVSWLCQ
jgi:hypothetical protein